MTKEDREEESIMKLVASEYGLVRPGDTLQVPGTGVHVYRTITVNAVEDGKIHFLNPGTGAWEAKPVRFISGTDRTDGWSTPCKWAAAYSQRVTKVR